MASMDKIAAIVPQQVTYASKSNITFWTPLHSTLIQLQMITIVRRRDVLFLANKSKRNGNNFGSIQSIESQYVRAACTIIEQQ